MYPVQQGGRIKSPLLYQLSYAPESAAEMPTLKYLRLVIQRQPSRLFCAIVPIIVPKR